MRKREKNPSAEYATAVGLIWGFMKTYNYQNAYTLARGCALIWPDSQHILLMQALAAAELKLPLTEEMKNAVLAVESPEWKNLLMRRVFSVQAE